MKKIAIHILILILIVSISSCDDFVNIDPPRTALIRQTVFKSDATAEAALLDVYVQLRSASSFGGGSVNSISFLMSLLSDEQINLVVGSPIAVAQIQQFNDNALLANNSTVFALWSDLYKCVYKVNAILEGLSASSSLSEGVKNRIAGEAKFLRAFCYFYLVNLWNDVPLTTSTDYRNNSNLPRASAEVIYQQIVDDLQNAKLLLDEDYAFVSNQRVRANKWAATALLARVFLYTSKWEDTEEQASLIISKNSLYELVPLTSVFACNSKESILQWWNNLRPNEYTTFRFNFSGALQSDFVNSFDPSDARRTSWVGTFPPNYVTLKYASSVNNPPAQYSTVLRLAEQYLIRAEARAMQNKFTEACADINVIRLRSSLSTIDSNVQQELLQIIEDERSFELFNEWGHRWFDLKRTNRADQLLQLIKPQWISTAVLLPIPEEEIIKNPSLRNSQNPGY
jgi:starch-binding outer membrane protein, SusD/RagB family